MTNESSTSHEPACFTEGKDVLYEVTRAFISAWVIDHRFIDSIAVRAGNVLTVLCFELHILTVDLITTLSYWTVHTLKLMKRTNHCEHLSGLPKHHGRGSDFA